MKLMHRFLIESQAFAWFSFLPLIVFGMTLNTIFCTFVLRCED